MRQQNVPNITKKGNNLSDKIRLIIGVFVDKTKNIQTYNTDIRFFLFFYGDHIKSRAAHLVTPGFFTNRNGFVFLTLRPVACAVIGVYERCRATRTSTVQQMPSKHFKQQRLFVITRYTFIGRRILRLIFEWTNSHMLCNTPVIFNADDFLFFIYYAIVYCTPIQKRQYRF